LPVKNRRPNRLEDELLIPDFVASVRPFFGESFRG